MTAIASRSTAAAPLPYSSISLPSATSINPAKARPNPRDAFHLARVHGFSCAQLAGTCGLTHWRPVRMASGKTEHLELAYRDHQQYFLHHYFLQVRPLCRRRSAICLHRHCDLRLVELAAWRLAAW